MPDPKLRCVVRIVYVPWYCEYCNTINGKQEVQKECTSCGKPFNAENTPPAGADVTRWIHEMEAKGGNLSISKAADIRRANAVAWKCKSCDALSNAADHPNDCPRCGTPRNPPRVPDVREDDTPTPKVRESVKPPPRTLDEMMAADEDEPDFSHRRDYQSPLKVAGGIALALLVFGAIFFFLQTHDSQGSVTRKDWTRTTFVDSCESSTHHNWCSDVHFSSVSNTGGRCGGKKKTNVSQRERKQVPDHPGGHDHEVTKRECKTVTVGHKEKCTSSGNGTAHCRTVPITEQKCENVTVTENRRCTHMVPVYDDWCSYQEWDWEVSNRKTANGAGEPGPFPELPSDSSQRTRHAATYKLTIAYQEDAETQMTSDEVSLPEYNSASVGDAVVVEVNAFNIPLDIRY